MDEREPVGIWRRVELAPPRNFRAVNLPRLCVSCSFLTTDGTEDGDKTYCVRPGGPVYETGTYEEWFNVCDNWKK